MINWYSVILTAVISFTILILLDIFIIDSIDVSNVIWGIKWK